MRAYDLTGQTFGKLRVLSRVVVDRRTKWLCVCDCKATRLVDAGNLVSGNTRSCGCGHREMMLRRNKAMTKHGLTGSPEYQTWLHIKQRCYDPNAAGYDRYGGRGIVVCDRWKDDPAAFIQDMGPRPGAEYSVDRINNDGPYSPENCRWATRIQQARNTRRTTMLTYKGETKPLNDWAEMHGLAVMTVRSRLSAGWDVERALTTPPMNHRSAAQARWSRTEGNKP